MGLEYNTLHTRLPWISLGIPPQQSWASGDPESPSESQKAFCYTSELTEAKVSVTDRRLVEPMGVLLQHPITWEGYVES